MKLRVALHIVGIVNIILSLTMLIPLFVSLFFKDGDTGVFIKSFVFTASTGLVLYFLTRTTAWEISHRDGFFVVASSWLSAVFFSSVPYMLSGHFPTYVDALFEAVSGLTTTGASILTDVEKLPHGIIFWRSLTHWIGGMGIVLLGLAVLPLLGIGGMQIYKAEASAVASEKLAPRVVEMARILLKVYLLISFVLLVSYIIAGMGLYDAFIHTFGTIATGGFSDRNASIAHYKNFFIELVTVLFMIIGGTNFALHYRFYHEGWRAYYNNSEFRFYIGVMALSTVIMALSLKGSVYEGFLESLRYSSFQTASIMTTTGYATADFALWPVFAQFLLFVLMFFGGSAGSTTGAIKCIRMLLLIKIGYREVYKLIHPHAVKPVKLDGRAIPQDALNAVIGFTFLYLTVLAFSALLLMWHGVHMVEAISAVAATLGCVGPGLGSVGPMANFSGIPAAGKCVLIADMLLGRLELYTLLVLLLPAYWRG